MNKPVVVIEKYFSLSEKQKEQFQKAVELYQYWNAKINVISRKDIDNIAVNHLLHSLGIAKVIHFHPNSDILDVGTGGGFPGIPLAIFFPKVHFHLIDSIGKKITVVKEVVKALQLHNVTYEQTRAEKHRDKYDFVVSRAVTQMKPFLGWIRNNIKPHNNHQLKNGVLYLKGGDLSVEMQGIKHQEYILSDFFSEPFFETKKVIYVPISC